MNNITFKQFIYSFNFRAMDNTKRNEDDMYDTIIIRIYPPSENFNRYDEWFEFGIYDFSAKDYTWDNCKKVLSKEILESYIDSICYDCERNNTVVVYLTKQVKYLS